MIYRNYKLRIFPNKKQERQIEEMMKACNIIYNKMLRMQYNRFYNYGKILEYRELAFFLTLYKKSEEYAFLKNTPSDFLQQKIIDLNNNFFLYLKGKRKKPRYKDENRETGLRSYNVKLDKNRIKFPFLSIKIKDTIGLKNITCGTIKKKNGKYYVSIVIKIKQEAIVSQEGDRIGIDLGVRHLMALSNGSFIDYPNDILNLIKHIDYLNKQLKNKEKESGKYRKTKEKINRLWLKLIRKRHDFQHKITTELTKRYKYIAVEDLNIQRMMKSSLYRKMIMYQGWSQIIKMLEYKSIQDGGTLVKVDPAFTSQTCPVCNHVSKENRKTQQKFKCVRCGYKENADIVASNNILKKSCGPQASSRLKGVINNQAEIA